MKLAFNSTTNLLSLFFILYAVIASVTVVEAQKSKPSGILRGKKFDTKNSKGILTVNSFEKGGGGGGPSACDGKYHSDNTPIVALSTRWFNNKKRCHHFINIHGNGKSVKAMVVDECASPCPNNVVDASKAVWKGLGIKENDKRWGWMDITWSDA